MISGIGLSLSPSSCRGAIFLCIVFYATSKVLVYTFLGRFSSPALTHHSVSLTRTEQTIQPSAYTPSILEYLDCAPLPTEFVSYSSPAT